MDSVSFEAACGNIGVEWRRFIAPTLHLGYSIGPALSIRNI